MQTGSKLKMAQTGPRSGPETYVQNMKVALMDSSIFKFEPFPDNKVFGPPPAYDTCTSYADNLLAQT